MTARNGAKVATADVLGAVLASSNETDRNGEMANVVDGLFAIARAIQYVGKALDEHAAEVANLAGAVRGKTG